MVCGMTRRNPRCPKVSDARTYGTRLLVRLRRTARTTFVFPHARGLVLSHACRSFSIFVLRQTGRSVLWFLYFYAGRFDVLCCRSSQFYSRGGTRTDEWTAAPMKKRSTVQQLPERVRDARGIAWDTTTHRKPERERRETKKEENHARVSKKANPT